jgi:hypothetical protein
MNRLSLNHLLSQKSERAGALILVLIALAIGAIALASFTSRTKSFESVSSLIYGVETEKQHSLTAIDAAEFHLTQMLQAIEFIPTENFQSLRDDYGTDSEEFFRTLIPRSVRDNLIALGADPNLIDFDDLFPPDWKSIDQIPAFPDNLSTNLDDSSIEARFSFRFLPATIDTTPISITFKAVFEVQVRGSGESFQAYSQSGEIEIKGMQQPFSEYAVFRQNSFGNSSGFRFGIAGNFVGPVYIGQGAKFLAANAPHFYGHFQTAEYESDIPGWSNATFHEGSTTRPIDPANPSTEIEDSPTYIPLPEDAQLMDLTRLALGFPKTELQDPDAPTLGSAEIRGKLQHAIGVNLAAGNNTNPPPPGVYVMAPNSGGNRFFTGGVYMNFPSASANPPPIKVKMEALRPNSHISGYENVFEEIGGDLLRPAFETLAGPSFAQCEWQSVVIESPESWRAVEGDDTSTEMDTVAIFYPSELCPESIVAVIPKNRDEPPQISRVAGKWSGVVYGDSSRRINVRGGGRVAPAVAKDVQLTIANRGSLWIQDSLTLSDAKYVAEPESTEVVADAWGETGSTCGSDINQPNCQYPVIPEDSRSILGLVSTHQNVMIENPSQSYAAGSAEQNDAIERMKNLILMTNIYAGYKGGDTGCSMSGLTGCGFGRQDPGSGDNLGTLTQLGSYVSYLYRGMAGAGGQGYQFNFQFDRRLSNSRLAPAGFPYGQDFIARVSIRKLGARIALAHSENSTGD